jgi:hypothetical protein
MVCACAVLLALCGCLEIQDELILQPDGSGSVRLEVTSILNPEECAMLWAMTANDGSMKPPPLYPPLNQQQASACFPAPGFEVAVREEEGEEDARKTTITASFKDLRTLLSSPYAEHHQLSLNLEGPHLRLRAKSGLEAIARSAMLTIDRELRDMLSPGLVAARKQAQAARAEFRVTLPSDLAGSSGRIEGRTSVWVFDRKAAGSSEVFLQQTAALLETSCSRDKLTFTPPPHPRLALLPFAQLAETTLEADPVDPQKVLAAVRYQPRTLLVTRIMNFSGNANASPRRSGSLLSGEVLVPREFVPVRWSPPQLRVALDASGQNLIPSPSQEGSDDTWGGSTWSRESIDAEPDEDTQANAAEGTVRREVVLSFRAPEWGVHELQTLKASISMHYPGPAETLKLTHAIPAAWILTTPEASGMRYSFDPEASGHVIQDPRSVAAGNAVRVGNATQSSAITSLLLHLQAGEGGFQGGQVFDADGQPWPTLFSLRTDHEQPSCSLLVIGRPKPPLSLALRISKAGRTVDVPIALERVPIDNN